MSLNDRDGRVRVIGVEFENNDIWLASNWNEFKQHYNIRFRDSLYFMYKGNNVFEVVIFGLNGLEKQAKRAKETKMYVYFFKRMVRVRLSFGARALPDAFTTLFERCLSNPMTLVASGDRMGYKVHWSCNLKVENILFLGGWRTFVNMFNIRRNDLLIFKFDWTDKMTVDVLPTDFGRIDKFHTGHSLDPWDINKHVWKLFTVKLNKSSAKKGQPLYVPAKVVKSDLSHRPETITVRLACGEYEQWTMIWSVSRNECKIGKGWYEFKEMNKLEAGDVVSFGRRGMQPFFQMDFEKLV